jgi:hypothetical protein
MGSKGKVMMKSHFVVKTSGGLASQMFGLISAIHISNKLQRPFKIKHYPNGTGGFYPIAIREFLSNEEILDLDAKTPGMNELENQNVGTILESHPLISKKFSYLHFVKWLHSLGLDNFFNLARLEWQLNASEERLLKSPKFLRSISGGYPPFYSEVIERNLKLRFKEANMEWPFKSEKSLGCYPDVVIHYRLGDKRTAYSKPGIGGSVNAIIDPNCFKQILDSVPIESKRNVYVISDEPIVAQDLLKSVGINALLSNSNGDLWRDIELMSSANILICPWSSVSQLIATFVSQQKEKRIFYPLSPGKPQKVRWRLENVEYYSPMYLGKEHSIYLEEYVSEASNGKSYNQ